MITYVSKCFLAVVVLGSISPTLWMSDSHADNLCIKNTVRVVRGAISLRGAIKTSTACPRGYSTILDTATLKGDAGADGSLRIYGDGSNGALAISTNTGSTAANHQYTDVTIAAGVTWTVPSGTVIRCTGTFTNNGTISVGTFAQGGRHGTIATSHLTAQTGAAHPGIGTSSASNGSFGSNTATIYGGAEGGGLTTAQALQIIKPGPLGGGGGGAGYLAGANGGGTVTVLCKGAVVNNGTISANGASTFVNFGDGGGGGGIVILASQTSVANSAAGTINVRGGNGSNSMGSAGAGGGGGGGWSHFIAPVISSVGTIEFSGGLGGSAATSVTISPRFGGGCGGSSYGRGGLGAAVSAAGTSNSGIDGDPGVALDTLADPTSLF